MKLLVLAIATASLVACSDDAAPAAPDATVDAAIAADAVVDGPPAAPSIGDVLDCGTPASVGGLGAGTDAQRVDLDATAFPDAVCNDGTRAFFYMRPAATAAGRDRWVIQLQGGGGCETPDACAKRWCSVDTNFGMTQMTATLSPRLGIIADGILQRGGAAGVPNPLGDYNHVFIRYCSSDAWSGTAGVVDVDAHHPISGAPVRFRIAFSGSLILDAVLATLRRDGAAPPPYTLAGGSVTMPDLDDATTVVLAGASAGGTGVIHNADRVRELLRAHNTACGGATCPLQYVAITDSAFAPDRSGLDWSATPMCTEAGLCSYAAFMTADTGALTRRRSDASCPTWHAAHAPATAYQCNDPVHVIRNHVTSPFLLRIGLTDSLLSSNMIDAGFAVPGRGPMTLAMFAERVRAQLLALPPSTPEEPFAVRPAVFGPPCDKHETLSNNPAVYETSVVAGGAPRTMFDLLGALASGGSPTTAVWSPGDAIDCPP